MEFLNMGGYAVFVWGSYAIALGLVSILYIKSTRELSKLESKLVNKTTRSEEVQSLPQEI
jgi:heme exporter protein CcmD